MHSLLTNVALDIFMVNVLTQTDTLLGNFLSKVENFQTIIENFAKQCLEWSENFKPPTNIGLKKWINESNFLQELGMSPYKVPSHITKFVFMFCYLHHNAGHIIMGHIKII